MKVARGAAALALLAASAGCTPEPTVEASGADSYVVSGRSSASDAGVLIAQNAALQDARAFCTTHGRRFLALANRVMQNGFSNEITYTVQFRCPPAGSPELQRPTVNQAPDDIL